ncbi:MAG: nuclear transport factor 2 family protein [Pyrinomonadaceae bacterium]
MKRYLSIFALVLAAAFSLQAQTAPDAAELTRLLNEFLAGAGKNDAAAHDRFWADDLIYTRSAGVRTNKEEIMKGLRTAPVAKPGDPVTVYTAEDIRIQQYGDAAVVAFKLVGNTTKADGTKTVSNNLNTGTFIKRKGKWQVVAWQSTIIPEPKPAAQTSSSETKAAPLVSKPSTSSASGSRTYIKGSRGGCYYLNASGNKTYVSHDLCK